MARTRRWVGGLAGILLVVSVGVSWGSAAVAVAPGAALNDVGRALAQVLDSPSERAWLRAAMDASPFVEHRVPSALDQVRRVALTGR